MFLNNLPIVYLLFFYIGFISFSNESESRLKKWVLIGINIVFTFLYYRFGKVSLEEDTFSLLVLLGSFIVLNKREKNGISLRSLNFNFLQLLSIYLLSINSFLYLLAGFSLYISSFYIYEKKRSFYILSDIFFLLVFFIFSFLYFINFGKFGLEKIIEIKEEWHFLLGVFAFILHYPLIKTFLLLIFSENESIPDKCLFPLVWGGAIFTKLAFVYRNLFGGPLLLELNNLFILIYMTLFILVLIKIENENEFDKKLLFSIFFSQALIGMTLVNNQIFSKNYLLVNFMMMLLISFRSLLNESMKGQFVSELMGNIVKLVLLIFLLSFPFTPWFSVKYLSLGEFIKTEQRALFIFFLLILGVRFRQDLVLVSSILKSMTPKGSKPS